jgi:hypothetical protein
MVREIAIGPCAVRMGAVRQLTLLPGWDSCSAGSRLISVAEEQLRRRGCALAFAAAAPGGPLEARGWVGGVATGCVRANPREVLAHLGAHRKNPSCRRRHGVRVWRQVELEDLCTIYARRAARLHGPLLRNEEDWRWLVSRRAFEQLAVVVDRSRGPRPENHEDGALFGYVVLDGERVVELMTLPGAPGAPGSLLEWACQETIERGASTMLLDLPADNRIDELLMASGGVRHPTDVDGRKRLVKILDHEKLTVSLAAHFRRRIAKHGLKAGCGLTVELDGVPCRLAIHADAACWQTQAAEPAEIAATAAGWTRLLLAGRTTGGEVRLTKATPRRMEKVRGFVRALFSGQALWWSSLEDRTAGR